MLYLLIASKSFLERLNVFAPDESAVADYGVDSPVNLRFDCLVLSLEVEEWDQSSLV